jgi:hypothetical protein
MTAQEQEHEGAALLGDEASLAAYLRHTIALEGMLIIEVAQVRREVALRRARLLVASAATSADRREAAVLVAVEEDPRCRELLALADEKEAQLAELRGDRAWAEHHLTTLARRGMRL